MRICKLSKKQKSNSPYSSNYQSLSLIGFKALNSRLKSKQNLKLHHITSTSYSLPFQATTKLFHSQSSKKFRKKD